MRAQAYNHEVRTSRIRSGMAGLTLVELMIVVVILGILAAIATISYRSWIGRARLSEASAILAELSSREQLYYSEVGSFVPARGDDDLTMPSPNESGGAFAPVDPNSASFDSVRNPTTIPASGVAGWRRIGARIRWNSLYCTYMVNAGQAGQTPPGPVGTQLWSSTPAVPWFYSVAVCNTQGASGYPNDETVLVVTYDSPGLRTLNDGK
jgi:prepilin-type N-terminal cleavage/methylation domain-containing protein